MRYYVLHKTKTVYLILIDTSFYYYCTPIKLTHLLFNQHKTHKFNFIDEDKQRFPLTGNTELIIYNNEDTDKCISLTWVNTVSVYL